MTWNVLTYLVISWHILTYLVIPVWHLLTYFDINILTVSLWDSCLRIERRRRRFFKRCIFDALLFNPVCAKVPVHKSASSRSFFFHWQRTVTHNPWVRRLAGPSVSTTTVVSTQTSETFAAHGCQSLLHTSSSQMQILLSSCSWAGLSTRCKEFSAPRCLLSSLSKRYSWIVTIRLCNTNAQLWAWTPWLSRCLFSYVCA